MSTSLSTPQRFNNSLSSKKTTTTIITTKFNSSDKVEDIIDNSQREISRLKQENYNLIARCEKAERESAKRQDGMVEMDILLTGYQIESERSLKEVELLKSKQKKLTDFLSKIYGRSWESDLALQLQSTTLPSTPISFSTPIYRKLGGARPSFTETPISSTFNNSLLIHSSTEGEIANDSISLEQQENRLQIEMIQALIKGYEDRVRRREIELNAMELRAKEESESGQTELEVLRVLVSMELKIDL